LLHGIAALAALVGLSAFTDWYVRLAWLLQSSVLLLFLLAAPLAWRHLRSGRGQQRLAGGAFLLYMAPVLVSIANYAGVIHLGPASLVSPFLANLVHIWLLHLALARQIREVEQEKQQLAQDAVMARAQIAQQRQQAEDHQRFLAMIAHEIRTPISVIRAANESLRVLGDDESSLRELRHERIERAVRRLDLLLELALHRSQQLEPGVAGQPARAVDLVALTREVLAQFADRDGIGLDAPVTAATVLAHPDLLHFVLVNLVDNACKYAPPGTPVQVRVAAATRDGRDGWCWSIEDSGPGVPVVDRERIFGRYVRLDERAGVPGLGLGLYIASGLVERDGGQLYCVEPRQLGGACFEIWLPGAAAAPAGDGA
jgi:signal transduction histidine kinase